MLSFVLGVSLTLNVISVIGVIIYLSVKNKSVNKISNKFVNTLDDEEIVDEDEAKEFMDSNKIDFSAMIRK